MVADRYRLIEPLGRGGFSEVWQAEDIGLGRAVAVKLFTQPVGQPDLVARFHREARVLAGLRHPNVVVVFDAGIDQGVPYLVMELLAGPSLDGLLARRGPLPAGLALGYAEQAAAGLGAAHAAGVVHRDIKPANLVLDSNGMLKIVDFGIARLSGASTVVTAAGVMLGTPAYLSPEQAAGRPAEPRSDLYALGCVLYALLAGEPPFTGEHPAATVHQHLNAPVPPVRERRPDAPPVIDRLLAALLAKNPQDRPPDAATVAAWLAQARSAAGPAAPAMTLPLPAAGPDGPGPPGRGPWRRWPLPLAAAAAIAAVLGALALIHSGGAAHSAQGASPASSRPPAATAGSQRQPAPRAHHHPKPAAPADAVNAVQQAVLQGEKQGAIQPHAATDLLNQLSEISKSISHGNLEGAGHKVSDLLHHLDDLTHNGQISAHGLALIEPPIRELVKLLPQKPDKPGGDHR
jgi:eukaryotic-like serine/threonine-protein kinase